MEVKEDKKECLECSYLFGELGVEEPCKVQFFKLEFKKPFGHQLRSKMIIKQFHSFVDLYDSKDEKIDDKLTVIDAIQRYGDDVCFVGKLNRSSPEWIQAPEFQRRLERFDKAIAEFKKVERMKLQIADPAYNRTVKRREEARLEVGAQLLEFLYSETVYLFKNQRLSLPVECDIDWNTVNAEKVEIAVIFFGVLSKDFEVYCKHDKTIPVRAQIKEKISNPQIGFFEIKRIHSSSKTKIRIKLLNNAHLTVSVLLCKGPARFDLLPDISLELVKRSMENWKCFKTDELLQRMDLSVISSEEVRGFRMFDPYYIQTSSEVFQDLLKCPPVFEMKFVKYASEVLEEFIDPSLARVIVEYCKCNGKLGFERSELPITLSSPYGAIKFSMDFVLQERRLFHFILFSDGFCILDTCSIWSVLNLVTGTNYYYKLKVFAGYYTRSPEANSHKVEFSLKHCWDCLVSGASKMEMTSLNPLVVEAPLRRLKGQLNISEGTLSTSPDDSEFWEQLRLDRENHSWTRDGVFEYNPESWKRAEIWKTRSPYAHITEFIESSRII
jgi:hypothetical protein